MVSISVTQEHIDNGTPKNMYRGPVALAILDATGRNMRVGSARAYLSEGYTWDAIKFTLPPEVARFNVLFDRGEPVSPFTFELPDEPM